MKLRYPKTPWVTLAAPGAVRTLRRSSAIGAAVTTLAVVMAGLPGLAQADVPTTTTFTFSGALTGTLHMPNGPCAGSGGQFSFDGKKLKGSKAKSWTLNVNSPSSNGGSWTKFSLSSDDAPGASVVLQGKISTKDYDWITKSGRITTARNSGSLSVTLVPDHSLSGAPGVGTVHLSGSWGCTSS